ncbi:YbaK/EbsC family protein [Chitinophaga sp. 22536]|uniref:YbaK/EbsC family protein n=1 Tax=unclassified Chitinophaga TaxID=2619133 RepID=UPI003F82D695
MAIEKVREHLRKWNRDKDIIELATSSATVELAGQALGVDGAQIAKSISLHDANGGALLIIASGYHKIDSKKFKDEFGFKARMLSFEEVEPMIGHAVGGVCPFGVNDGVKVYLDESLKAFDNVYPACGSSNSAIKMTIADMEEMTGLVKWVDVTKPQDR